LLTLQGEFKRSYETSPENTKKHVCKISNASAENALGGKKNKYLYKNVGVNIELLI